MTAIMIHCFTSVSCTCDQHATLLTLEHVWCSLFILTIYAISPFMNCLLYSHSLLVCTYVANVHAQLQIITVGTSTSWAYKLLPCTLADWYFIIYKWNLGNGYFITLIFFIFLSNCESWNICSGTPNMPVTCYPMSSSSYKTVERNIPSCFISVFSSYASETEICSFAGARGRKSREHHALAPRNQWRRFQRV